ncbi:MAG: rRNA cytosine-C5-methyltransferase [Candidatus Cryptobacteroides sp.]
MLKESFRKYLEEAIGSDNALVAFSALDTPASVSVRLNPSKPCLGAGALREAGKSVPWSPLGILLDDRPVFTLDPHFHCGAYYVQDSSAMFVGNVFRRFLPASKRPLKVLDLCAAPGGKTTDIAASLRQEYGDSFILVANEVMKQRCSVLAGNAAIWGDPNVVVTNDDPRAFSSLEGFFDVIVADVPCSGEGMFRKDEGAVEQWSEDNVALCAARQKRIVADVWNSLAEGGVFIYSTCTFNRYENDCNAQWIVSELGAEPLTAGPGDASQGVLETEFGYSLVPGLVPGEGQYCAAFRKTSSCGGGSYASGSRSGRTAAKGLPVKSFGDLFSVPMSFRVKGQTIVAVPSGIEALVSVLESSLHTVAAGCAVGVMKGDTLVPDADLALSLKLAPDAFPMVELDRNMALSFLHRDSMVLPDAPRGYVAVTHDSLPLGFVKNLGTRCNNLLPQGRRIRMGVE